MTARGRVVVVGRGTPERGGIPSYLEMMATGEGVPGYDVVTVNLGEAHHRAGGAATPSNLRRVARDVFRVISATRRGDIVHVHSALAPGLTGLRAGLLLAAGRARGGIPVVHAHGGLLVRSVASGRWARRLVRLSMLPAVQVLAVAGVVRDALVSAGVPESRVRLVSNGVDCARFAPPSSTGQRQERVPRVLFVGGLTERKGVLDLLAASGELIAEGTAHELVLVGGVPDEGEEAHRVVTQALAVSGGHVRSLGTTEPRAMAAHYAEADVFCLPSWWEAAPLTVLEAMASGLPVVASDVGDVSRVILEGRTGLVVPAGDRDALRVALGELLRDLGLRATMGVAARARAVEQFDHRITLAALSGVYDEVRGTA